MIILKKCEKINICVEESVVIKGSGNFKIMYLQRIYDGKSPYKCEERGYPVLPKPLQNEYADNVGDAIGEFNRLVEMFHPKSSESTPDKSNFGDALQDMMLKVLAEQSAEKVVDFAKPLIDEHIRKTYGSLPEVKIFKMPDGATKKIEGVTHEKFEDVLNLVLMDIPVFLTGKAGTGKNVICKQVADALGLEFYFTNAVTQEYKLTGFIDAMGKYQETQFYKAFTDGGLFFLDEMDASIPEVLIILNSALANKYFDFPNGKVDAHKDFRVISAGNTFGTGADIEYTGRFQLDMASLDRFAMIEVDYSEEIETALAENDREIIDFARVFRKVADNSGIKCLFSYRTVDRLAKLKGVFPPKDAIKMSLTKGLRSDDIRILYNELKGSIPNNLYVMALKELM